jgi:hypothetical protein
MHPETLRELGSIRTRLFLDEASGSNVLARARFADPTDSPPKSRLLRLRSMVERGIGHARSAFPSRTKSGDAGT